jgi:hypothetical protein
MPSFAKCCNTTSNNGGGITPTPVDPGSIDTFMISTVQLQTVNISENNLLDNQDIYINSTTIGNYSCCIIDESFSANQIILDYGGDPKENGPTKKFYLRKNNSLKSSNPVLVVFNNVKYKIESIDYNKKEARLKKISDTGASVSKTFRMEDNDLLIEIRAYEFKG